MRKALQMYRHGIACLDENSHWTSQYSLSIKLFGAAAEASCHLNELDSVKSYSDAVEIHARSIDDKLPCALIQFITPSRHPLDLSLTYAFCSRLGCHH